MKGKGGEMKAAREEERKEGKRKGVKGREGKGKNENKRKRERKCMEGKKNKRREGRN